MARGFSQVEGIDYDKTFSPVARYTSIRTIMAIATEMGWRIHQMEVKTTFLNGILEEEVYIEQPQGFGVSTRDTHVCRLRKALYGLKQAPRAWYSRIDTYLQDLGVRQIRTSTIWWMGRIQSFVYCMLTISSLQERRGSLGDVRWTLLRSSR